MPINRCRPATLSLRPHCRHRSETVYYFQIGDRRYERRRTFNLQIYGIESGVPSGWWYEQSTGIFTFTTLYFKELH